MALARLGMQIAGENLKLPLSTVRLVELNDRLTLRVIW